MKKDATSIKAVVLPMDAGKWEDLGIKKEKGPLLTIISVILGRIDRNNRARMRSDVDGNPGYCSLA